MPTRFLISWVNVENYFNQRLCLFPEFCIFDYMKVRTDLYLGDSKEVLKQIPNNSVDLIFTSPPYADQRKNTYGGIPPNKYVEWFMPIGEQLHRVLKPTGTFVLNIKERVVNGERSTYVIELILEMRKIGWLWTEEFIWHKKNSYPGKWPNRFRDSWERLIQFNKDRKFNMYQEEVMVPMGDWSKTRLKKLSETDKKRDESKVGSGFGKNISNWLYRDMAYPTNVLHLATECNNKNHSAAFPERLPEWFIRLLTKEGDTVLDPFMGYGNKYHSLYSVSGVSLLNQKINSKYGQCRAISNKYTIHCGLFVTIPGTFFKAA